MKQLYFSLIILVLVLGCVTNPEYPRVNPNDPKSDLFVPEFFNLAARLGSNDVVTITWLDQTYFEDGYIISKKLGDTFIQILDTLAPSVQGRFIDRNQEFDVNTEYIVSSFMIRGDTLSLGSTKTTSLYLGTIENLTSTVQSSSLRINWDNNVRINHEIRIMMNGIPDTTLSSGSSSFEKNISAMNSPIEITVMCVFNNFNDQETELIRVSKIIAI